MIGLALSAALVASSSLAARVVDPKAIDLHAGVNRLGPLGPNGADILVVRATPNVEVGNQNHTVFVVLTRETGKDWVLAPFCPDDATDGGCPDVTMAAPHNGEDGTLATAFARATVEGRPALVSLQAKRDMTPGIDSYAGAPVEVRVSVLTHEAGFDETFFREIGRAAARGCYVDASLALNVVFGLPLPAGYEGARSPAPCPPAQAHDSGR